MQPNPPQQEAKPALHLQIIRTAWTKASRGAPGATARARIPLHLPVNANVLGRGNLSVEIVRYGEADSFHAGQRVLQTQTLENLRFKYGAFFIQWDRRNATTGWQWSWNGVGAPEPQFFNRDMGHFEVPPDNWVRLRWHGRFGGRNSWSYQQTVVNLARCDADLDVDFSGEPSRCFEWLPQLW